MFDFLTPKISPWIIGVLLLALSGLYAGEELRISNWKKDYNDMQADRDKKAADLIVSQSNEAVLSAKIDQQNAAILALKAEQRARDAAAALAASVALQSGKDKAAASGALGSGADIMNGWFQRQYGAK